MQQQQLVQLVALVVVDSIHNPSTAVNCCVAAACPAGKQLLTVWDRLCVLLRARAVSVEDVSNKSGMLLRVLHTAAFGTTW
jgi:hypothetical protein